ncbi:MAG: DUF4101 domain-containing protein [Leptolyngbyaceae cyanobacterium RU_5_1]|nr:DUF4101 domain-containing protein [Leptolyngbyaceae cyanobacterium RU_5_1]
MRLRFNKLILLMSLIGGVGILPAQAQVSDSQVGALVEALRLAAPRPDQGGERYYSEWTVKAENIPRWSQACLGRSLTPEQFEASPVTARGILVCVIRDVLRDEYRASGSNEAIAVRRSASWWMTGSPDRYNSGDTATYTQKVLSFYQQNKPVSSTKPNSTQFPTPPGKPVSPLPKPQSANQPGAVQVPTQPSAQPPTQSQSKTVYDRYMQAGYAATNQRDNRTALLYFKRALDERPDDPYATQAIRNVESYLNRPSSSTPSTLPTPRRDANNQSSRDAIKSPTDTLRERVSTLTPQNAVQLINQWLQAKAEIFAPPFDRQQAVNLTTGELLAALIKPDGVLTWLKSNRAYYRYGVQRVESVERFVATRDRATIELKVTEDRTLYLNGTIDPNQTDFSIQHIRFSLEVIDGIWKIADYKTVDGFLLERSILDNASSANR